MRPFVKLLDCQRATKAGNLLVDSFKFVQRLKKLVFRIRLAFQSCNILERQTAH